ncbi:MAG TPA: PspC domain-containing protein, partial [Ornithinibacter sp.]|nr:PspC domain-containing protein [Ornithinibacter sp.]
MPTPYEPAAAPSRAGTPPSADAGAAGTGWPAGPARPPLVRARGRGWTPGVCAAVARHLGLSTRVVRWAFVILTLIGGAGVVAYAFLWALTPEGDLADGATG